MNSSLRCHIYSAIMSHNGLFLMGVNVLGRYYTLNPFLITVAMGISPGIIKAGGQSSMEKC